MCQVLEGPPASFLVQSAVIRVEAVDQEDDGGDKSLGKPLSIGFYFHLMSDFIKPSSNGTSLHRLSRKHNYPLKQRSPRPSSSSARPNTGSFAC